MPDVKKHRMSPKQGLTYSIVPSKRRAIVKAYGFGGEASLIPAEQLSQAFIVEEYLSGGTLLELLESTAAHKAVSYTLADAFRWMVDAADAIHYLHSMQPGMVIHRDIKPDNMLLDHRTPGQAKVKLTDFGLHRVIARKTGMPSSILERDILSADTNRGAICANATGESYKLTGGTGSVMYMAPGTIIGAGEVSCIVGGNLRFIPCGN